MVNCRENIALCGKHKPIDGQTTSTMYVYHCGSHDRNVQKFEHQRDMACQFYSGSAVQEKWIKTLDKNETYALQPQQQIMEEGAHRRKAGAGKGRWKFLSRSRFSLGIIFISYNT